MDLFTFGTPRAKNKIGKETIVNLSMEVINSTSILFILNTVLFKICLIEKKA